MTRRDISSSTSRRPGGIRGAARAGFTLLELLVVIVIISIIAGIGVPAVRGLSHSHVMTSASQQLADDLAVARHTAISYRTTVYVLFVPHDVYSISLPRPTPVDTTVLQQLWGRTYTSYALYVDRMAGDQPGQGTPRYLTEWRSLPDGVFIGTNSFGPAVLPSVPGVDLPLAAKYSAAFPSSTSVPLNWTFPCVAFDYTGALVDPSNPTVPLKGDQLISLDRGSVFYARNTDGTLKRAAPEVVETQTDPSVSGYGFCRIRINHLTGRVRIEKPTIQ